MPYNLRKRKTQEVAEPVVKRQRAPTKAGKDKVAVTKAGKNKVAVTKAEDVEVEATIDEEIRVVDTKAEPTKAEPTKAEATKAEATKVVATKAVAKESAIKADCNQLVFGNDTCGELGFKKIGCTKKKPTPVPLDARIKQVACGPMHTLSLTEDGVIYSYGCNDEGALGRVTDGDETLDATPTIIDLKNKVTKISTGDSHGAALTDKNEVFVWGNFRDEKGSVGILPECNGEATYKPIQVLPEKKFKDIASGSNHMLLLDEDGVVYSFGVGAQGQLGRPSSEQIQNVVDDREESVAITADNRDLFLAPKPVSMKNVDLQREFICDAVYAGNMSSFATNTDKRKNRLAAWGLNNFYQLGYKGLKGQIVQCQPKRSTFTCSTSMVNVGCGQHHTIFLTRTGRVYAAGRNEYGMLGIGQKKEGAKDEIVPAKSIDAFDAPISTICAGINTSFAVSNGGKLFAWGMNGQNLGIESEEDLMVPTEVKNLASQKVISVSSGSSFTAVIVE